MLKTGLHAAPANAGKRAQLAAVLREYRATATTLARGQWKLFFTTGRFDRNAKLNPATVLSARYVQTCQYQVVAQLTGFIGNCERRFRALVQESSLPEATRVELLYLAKYQSWYKPDVVMRGVLIPQATLRLARNLMRHVLKTHRQPCFDQSNMALDAKVAVVEPSRQGEFAYWLKLSTLAKGKPIAIPLERNGWFERLSGPRQAFAQINLTESGAWRVGLIKDIAPDPYQPRCALLGLDVGLKYLLASSEGDLLGRGVFAKLKRWDAQISRLAANRQRAGLKVRSARYDTLVRRVRAYLKNEIHRTLRQVLLRHKPEKVAIERLDFRSPAMSRRMNRLIQNFGRTEFKAALAQYAAFYGFDWVEVEPAYSSQTCRLCGYVDPRNRAGDHFRCLHCGHPEQADVHASRNIALRVIEDLGRSRSMWTGRRRSRPLILQSIVERFLAQGQRFARLQRSVAAGLVPAHRKRLDSKPCDNMLSNPYHKGRVPAYAPAAA